LVNVHNWSTGFDNGELEVTYDKTPLPSVIKSDTQTPSAKLIRAHALPHPAGTKPKLLDQMREAMRSRHYSRRTEQTYSLWVKRFIYFHNVRHPAEMAEPEINSFLTHLAVKERISSSTQNQALSALLFLYRHVLGREIGNLGEVIRARKPKRIPVVMTREEVKPVLCHLTGDKLFMASLMYGAGLRLMECLRLRVQDMDFGRNEITVRDGKGGQDRITMLPESLKEPLRQHLVKTKQSMKKTLKMAMGMSRCPLLWIANILMHPANGVGSGSSLRRIAGKTRRLEK
jgi:site-specific recombinase XerD